MSPRRYQQKRRSLNAEQTRTRIVEACMAVHGRKGILNTSVRDIAAEADVSPGTVLFHFPDTETMVEACGRMTQETFPHPGTESLASHQSLRERLEAALSALFQHYEQAVAPSYEILLREREQLPRLDRFFQKQERAHKALVRATLTPFTRSTLALKFVIGLSHPLAWRSLRHAGLSNSQAVITTTEAICAWLDIRYPQRSD